MKVLKHLLSALMLVIASVAPIALIASPAQASSTYDNVINPTDKLEVSDPGNGSCIIDVTESWESLFRSGLSSSDLASYNARAASVVFNTYSEAEGQGYKPTAVWIYWWSASEMPVTATFTPSASSYSPQISLKIPAVKRGYIAVNWGTCTAEGGMFGSFAGQAPIAEYDPTTGRHDVRPYYSHGLNVAYPTTGYEGSRLPTGKKYVALGDSYSSGEGAFSYYTESGGCHRSEYSYPVHLKMAMSISNFDFDFAACSGAVTHDIFTQNPNNTAENAQFSKLGNRTEVVTLTIGGNDIDFAGIMNKCVSKNDHSGDDCKFDTSITGPLANRLNALAGTPQSGVYAPGGRTIHAIETVITQIATAAPNAKIYIAGYPELFGSSSSNFIQDSSAPGDYKCAAWGAGFASVSYSDAQWLNSMASQLNSVIENAVNSLSSVDVTYVPNTKFDGHGLCDTSSSYILGAITDTFFNVQSESFHPNVTGMENGYGVAFSELID